MELRQYFWQGDNSSGKVSGWHLDLKIKDSVLKTYADHDTVFCNLTESPKKFEIKIAKDYGITEVERVRNVLESLMKILPSADFTLSESADLEPK